MIDEKKYECCKLIENIIIFDKFGKNGPSYEGCKICGRDWVSDING